MAQNRIFADGSKLSVVVSSPTTPAAGDAVRYGNMTGVALVDEGGGGNGATETTVDFGMAVWDLSTKGEDGSGNSAVAVGDALYYNDADAFLSKKSAGYFFGIALEAVSSGATATINVLHLPVGAQTLGSGSVGTTELASGAVTTAKIGNNQVTVGKLGANLGIGFIPLPLAEAREITTNDIPAGAANGGLLAKDTTPIFERVNGATDKQLRVNWAASNSDEIAWQFAYPPDLDDTANVEVHFLAAMGGAIDTPVVAVSYFEGLGDSNAGGNSGAVTGTAVAEYSVAIAAANIGAQPNVAQIGFVPGAHTTDAFYLLAAWVEYTRKS